MMNNISDSSVVDNLEAFLFSEGKRTGEKSGEAVARCPF